MHTYKFGSIRKIIGIITVAMLLVLQSGCGSTSGLKPTDEAGGQAEAVESRTIDLSSYKYAVIGDFSDSATANKKFKSNEKGMAKKAEYVADVQAAGGTFAGYLQAELTKLNVFENVARGNQGDSGTLLIDGEITRFARGNAAAKLLVGFGAGSTYFDATVNVRDGVTGNKLGEILVDKNSWALGGVVSATQSVESFMRGGAKKTAQELYEARYGEKPSK